MRSIYYSKTHTKLLIALLLIIMHVEIGEASGCTYGDGYWNCGYDWRYGECYEHNDGSFWSCGDISGWYGYSLGRNSGWYNRRCNSWDWWGNCDGYERQYIDIAIYRKCAWECTSCDGQSNPAWNCQTCRGGSWKWAIYDRCWPYCPSVSIGDAVQYGFGTNQPGQYKVSADNFCRTCDSRCNFCDGSTNEDCWSCVGGYRLIDDTLGTCNSRFTTAYGGPQWPCYYSQCFPTTNTCPKNYYYVIQSTVNSVEPFNTWSWQASHTNSYDNSNVYYRRYNNDGVCYVCDEHCETCDGLYQTNCLTCSRYNYLWSQRGNYCQESCPFGDYYYPGWRGEYINEAVQNTVTGVGDRVCRLCNVNCRWCRSSASNCLNCRDGSFLLDLHTECMARYIDPNNCSVCTDPTYDMCRNSAYNVDNLCVDTQCPTHFYFQLYRGGTGDDGVLNSRYDNITYAVTESYINGSDNAASHTLNYRRYTNLCMLCDYRCVTCTGPMNTACSKCRNGFYKWTNNTVCDDYCPIGQYIARDQPHPINETECRACYTNCKTCEIYSQNCSSCVGGNYAWWNGVNNTGNVAFLWAGNQSWAECKNICPEKSFPDYQTQIGMYGSFVTLTCYPCPTPCSVCDVSIIKNNYPDIACSDNYCSNGLVCTQCLLGYVVAGGKCVAENTCRQYAYYDPPLVSAPWSAVNCKCLDGYTLTTFAKCGQRCHVSCFNCTGPLATDCIACYGQYVKSGGACVINTDVALNAYSWVVGSSQAGLSIYPSTPTSCGTFSSLFGYEDQNRVAGTNTATTGKYFGYPVTMTNISYYAVKIKVGLLFVDEFHPRGAIYISRGSSGAAPIWTWNYNTKGAYGQQMCGTNKMDYVIYVTAEIPTRNTTSQTFYITSNENFLENQLGYQLHWGIQSVLITVLKCHWSCNYCSGPAANQCLTCNATGYIQVNNTCVCDISANYYYWSDNLCHLGCPGAGWYRDSQTRSCVNPPTKNCTAPKRFGDSLATTTYGSCVISCPPTYYASSKNMKCTTNCYITGVLQYKFNYGGERTCQDPCPAGYIKDIINRECVLKCPSTTYFRIENATTDPTCVYTCPSGWEYDGLQLCVTSCPNGYFRQTISTHNKCVQTCTNAFGDPSSGNCTLSCPFPTYADPYTKMCVDTCSNVTQFMQVKISNLNRTCVDECEPGQWANPFTFKCSNVTTDCPDGYFADSTTHMCEPNCTVPGQVAENSTKECRSSCLTGFAHADSRVCVSVCPSNPSMFGLIATKTCVYSCNYASTGLYGDAQANRTCVQRCSSTPSPTYGYNTTSLCVDKCPGTSYGDPADIYRRCVTSCSSVPIRYANTVTKQCVLICPDTYFGEIVTGVNSGVCVQTCLAPNFGDPDTNWCRPICKWGYYGLPINNRPCVEICPRYWFGMNGTTNRLCVQTCDDGFWGDVETSMCYNVKTSCSNNTYADAAKRLCVNAPDCTEGSYADPFTKGCEATCSNGYYADENINTCVEMCSDSLDEYGQWGICRYTCIVSRFADPQANRTCVRNCSRTPLALFGIIATRRVCVTAANCPTNFYGDNTTLLCVNPCTGTFPFGDPISKQCVSDCPDGYYGDRNTNLCVQRCNFATYHYADNITGNCQTLCTLGTFGVNSSALDSIPSCEEDCPPGSFARDSDRICVADCGAGLYGDPILRKCVSDPFACSEGYYANSVAHLCSLPADCQTVTTHYFAQNSTKTCVVKCLSPNYGDSKYYICTPVCNETSFGENTTRLCKTDCTPWSSYAENQNNLCVARCSNTPIKHYAEDVNHTCVEAKNCPISTTQTYAQNSSQKCVQYCGTGQWADPTTFRCVAVCPNGYFADDSTGHNLCSTSCPGYYRFRDNSTRSCVSICPLANRTFGDADGDACVYTCPSGTFAQNDTNRRCVPTCSPGTWGNKISRICITNPITQCPTDTWGDNSTQKCEEVCASGSGYYGYNVTRLCVTSCPSPTFAWDGSRVCIDICPASLVNSGYFGDPMTTPTRKCFLTCQTALYYRDVAASRTCATSCTYNSTYKTYKDPTTMSCEAVCSTYPQFRYADDNLKSCQTSCAGTLKKNDATQKCIATCPYLYDPTTDKCVDICPTESSSGPLFANLTNNICVVATSCPTGTYVDTDSRTCALSCPNGTYKNGIYCVYYCPANYFIDPPTQSCVLPVNCSTGLIADNQTRSCISQCIGTYAESTLNRCIDVCYGSKYGDPFTHKCEVNCSQGLFKNNLTKTCVASCAIGLYANPATANCSATCASPYYADNSTMSCVTSCSANPMTFASVSSTGVRECVGRCDVTKMHDMVNRICINTTSCPTGTYSYSVNMSCVSFCPGPSYYRLGTACITNCSTHATLKYADDLSRTCVSTCPTGTYKDPLSFKCVETCPTAPAQYYISVSQGNCTKVCPQGTYADPQELLCVANCSLSPPMFAQEVNNVCVQTCPLAQNSYADLTSGKCVNPCPSGYFTDNRDRTCKQNCSHLFADSTVNPKACVATCSGNTFADQLTYTCVSTCPPNYYKHTLTWQCVRSCPFPYYLNPLLSLCVLRAACPATIPYADNLTRTCTSLCSSGQFGHLATGTTTGGHCRYYCPSGFFSNPRNGTCVTACPEGLFAETDNNTCMEQCTYDKFMDMVNNKCVTQCPAANNLYANLYNRTCVTQCDPATFTYADDLTRVCEQTCTDDQYADNETQKCVGPAQCSGGLFSDPHLKMCVEICYNGTYGYLGECLADCPTAADDVYASLTGFICVTPQNCPNGTYADPVLHQCVEFCPIQSGTFADDKTRRCLPTCNSPLFADNLTRTCVDICPNVSKMYGDSVNHKCVLNCPYPKFADQTTNMCNDDCPDGYFAETSTLSCVQKCPEGKYGNNVTNQCQETCPSLPNPYYGDPDTRQCVLYCPEGKYADIDNNRECHPKCIGNPDTYAENSTNECLETCLTGFANIRTKQCIAVCTAGYYGYEGVCHTNCPSTSPTVYADNETHLCVQTCPNGTFADLSTLKCVKICPISDGTFGDTIDWVCTDFCPTNYYADNSTRMCVETCPQSPAMFGKLPERICVQRCTSGFYADNSTRTCRSGCPFGTYADNISMKCEPYCPSKLMLYGQNITNKCVYRCWADRDMYADNLTRTCVYHCSPNSFAYYNNSFRACVKTCPLNYYAVNGTRRCETGCPANSFADPLMRICVAVCPVDPIYYGDPNDHFCKPECPTGSFGNPLTQQCVFNTGFISNCPPQYYGDITTMLCVQVCPKKYNLYGDPYLKKCQSSCSNNLLADNSTMRCVQVCPEYPSYFADLDLMKCVPFCPPSTFADVFTRTCVENCPNGTFADLSTLRCVEVCPQQPLTYGDESSWTCVDRCPGSTYSDNSTLRCVDRCPYEERTFADNDTNSCVRVCPQFSFGDQESGYCVDRCYGGRYSDNVSRLCLEECPRYPPSYADPTSDECVQTCPPSYYAFQDNRTCVQTCPQDLYRQNSSSSCVRVCDYLDNSYADNLTGFCVERCSRGSWADPTIRVCVAVCPDQPLLYADNSSQSCVQRCPGSTFGENTTRTCVNSCPIGSLSLPQKNLCVRYCPIGYFAYNVTSFCFDQCPGDYYGDPSTRSCVLTCPLNQLLFADNSSKQCVKTCPDNSYADKKSVQCVSVCPDANATLREAQTYAADYINVCVEECALPYYAFLPQKKCVTTCPNPYFNSVVDHLCKLCPSVCISCTTYDVCTSCLNTYYLQNGKCVFTCSNGYYANQANMRCVASALCRPYYGINSTHSCSPTCPTATYKNNDVFRCDACQPQCLTCTGWTYCLTCDTVISAMYQNYCYLFCEINDTNANSIIEQNYSPDNATCCQNCPAGTYLFVIFCKNCSAQCETCVGTSTNCTRCSNGLYLQSNVCVISCSEGYKPAVSRDCVFCGTSCGNSLTFETNITQINGQNTVFITFSDNITVNGDPNTIFGLQLNSRRRLLGAGYTIVVVDSKTIKIILDNSMDASSYTVRINQPEKIQDIYGNLPAKVRDQVQFDLSNTYTSNLQSAPSNFSNYFLFLSAICVISFLFDIEFMKFMQLLFVHYFVIMILPPQLSKVLLAFRWSTLNYLPTMYSSPEAVLRGTITGKLFDAIGDYSFLRTAGFALTPLAVVIFLWIIIKLLSIPEINRFKEFRIWCKEQLDEKFKFAIQVQWLSIMYLNTIFFIFMQMKDYNQYDTYTLASIVIAHIILVLIAIFFVFLIYRVISLFRENPKLSENLKKATELILQENEYHKLNSSNIFLFQMKKIDLRNLYYPKVNNENILPFRNIYKFSFLPLCCILVTYLRATILSLIIVFGNSTLLQLSLCIALNVACLLYFSRARPFSFKYRKRRIRNYIAIFHEVALIGFELLMLALAILDRDLKTSFEKQSFSMVIIYYLCVVCTISFIYFLFRIGVQIYRRVWMPFTETEIFRVNFPQKYAQLHGSKKQKLLRGVDPKAKEALRALIKGYKKNKSSLRPNEEDKANPQLPMKYKITYFDRDGSSIDSKSSMSKAQKRKMLKQIFQGEEHESMKNSKVEQAEFEELEAATEKTEAEYEQYEQEIEIKAKYLAKYVKNADQLLRLKKMHDNQKLQE